MIGGKYETGQKSAGFVRYHERTLCKNITLFVKQFMKINSYLTSFLDRSIF